MNKNDRVSMITSLNGKQKISIQKFDQLFDSGSDEIDDFIDWTKVQPGVTIRPGEKVMCKQFLHGKMASEKIHVMGEKEKKENHPIYEISKIKRQISLSPEAFKRVQKFAKNHHLDFSSAIEAAALQLT